MHFNDSLKLELGFYSYYENRILTAILFAFFFSNGVLLSQRLLFLAQLT
jgi:hypothetical protein